MARRKSVKDQSGVTFIDVLGGSDLPLRIEKISEQVGLSPINLLQKWVLQEESVVGLMQRINDSANPAASESKPASPAKAAPARQDAAKKPRAARQKKEPAPRAPRKQKDAGYRETLLKRVEQLRQDGVTLQKIAEIFNNENLATLSGTGKWFASSVKHLLSAK